MKITRSAKPPTKVEWRVFSNSIDCREKESIIVVAGLWAESVRPSLKFSTSGSLLLAAEPLPLAVFVVDLLEARKPPLVLISLCPKFCPMGRRINDVRRLLLDRMISRSVLRGGSIEAYT